MDKMKKMADGKTEVPLKHFIGRLAMDIISRVSYEHALFGLR